MRIISLRRHLKRVLFYWLPLILWMIWIYYLSDQPALPHPGRQMGISDLLFDYSAHAFTFGVLTWLIWRVLNVSSREPFQPLAPHKSGFGAALYAASDEIHQSFVAGRCARLLDWGADLAGILVAFALLYVWQDKRGKTRIVPKAKRGRRS